MTSGCGQRSEQGDGFPNDRLGMSINVRRILNRRNGKRKDQEDVIISIGSDDSDSGKGTGRAQAPSRLGEAERGTEHGMGI